MEVLILGGIVVTFAAVIWMIALWGKPDLDPLPEPRVRPVDLQEPRVRVMPAIDVHLGPKS